MHRTQSLCLRGISGSLPPFSRPVPGCRIQIELGGHAVPRFSPTYSRRRLLSNNQNHRGYPPNNSGRLHGRTCMITGGSSGIGHAVAERFLQEGATRVILVGRSYERLSRAASQLENSTLEDASVAKSLDSKYGSAVTSSKGDYDRHQNTLSSPDKPGTLVESSSRISLLVGDVSEAGEWARELENAMVGPSILFLRKALYSLKTINIPLPTSPANKIRAINRVNLTTSAQRPVDILINAAGISTSSILPKTDPKEISQVLRTNLEGAILTSRALIRATIRNRMRNNRDTSELSDTLQCPSKCIINISSLLALKGGTGAVPYAASKAGILGLTRSLAVEASGLSLASQIVRSNAIVPGYIETPMIANFSQDENNKLKNNIPLRRFGKPEEIADAAVFLAHNEYANNCVINLDGGLSAV